MENKISEIQSEILSPDCDLVSVLRKAHLHAIKMGLDEFDQWLLYELNGYPNQQCIPEFRRVHGVVKANNPVNGWIPVAFSSTKIEEKLSKMLLPNPLAELIHLCETDGECLVLEFNNEAQKVINGMFSSPIPMRFALHISYPAVKSIIESVKTSILDWTVKLEGEGSAKEDTEDSEMEKEKYVSSLPIRSPEKIFIVHGHDDAAKQEMARTLEKAGFEAIILHEQADSGKTIIEKIEKNTDVSFAVVLYTECDYGRAKEDDIAKERFRARQNVVFEHGYLIGKLGRDRVCALVKGNVETPGDISGVVYTPMDAAGAWKMQLGKNMKDVGLDIDMNKLI